MIRDLKNYTELNEIKMNRDSIWRINKQKFNHNIYFIKLLKKEASDLLLTVLYLPPILYILLWLKI